MSARMREQGQSDCSDGEHEDDGESKPANRRERNASGHASSKSTQSQPRT